ncbi:uncharacterized protein [Parasteatoda tepidariorum]|uniref:uncharacterized protein n=1 Tax=Parasteatoda tepidariorum TaxID=114398 RepID=UPI00077FC1A9|nr:uncharacterized protein LOC107442620 [Parasteatoda tepidariorum]
MNSPEFIIYMMVVAIFSMMWVCCRLYCRHACKDEREGSNDDNIDCEGCCCYDDHSLENPSHARAPATTTWQPPVQQQPRQLTDFGTLSTEPNTLSFYNRANFEETLATATIFAQGSSNFQAPLEIANAPPRYDFMNAPSVPHPYNAPSESHIYNIPSIPAAVHSVNADDPPPDYASVVLGDLLQGNEHTQFPRVTQDK